MEEVTHRQMRNDSAEILRRVAGGETVVVTNGGRPAAIMGPPTNDAVALLAARGQLREAVGSPATLKAISRTRSSRSTVEIVEDVRGRW